MYKDEKNFTKDPLENNGRCRIHPLSSEGIEFYLNSNYHYLKSKNNPELLQQIKDEIEEEKRKKLLESQQNEQKEKISTQEEPKANEKGSNDPNVQASTKSGNKKGKKGVSNKKSPPKNINNVNFRKKMSPKKIDKINASSPKKKGNLENYEKKENYTMPKISNVNSDRGSLKDYPLPHHN